MNSIQVLEAARSTNNLAWQMTKRQLPALIVCELQVAGRGRHNHSWISEHGKSLTFSLTVDVDKKVLTGLSLVVAIAVAKTLRACKFKVALKWPNDVLDNLGRKLAGILIETSQSKKQAVLGIGINLWPLSGASAVGQTGVLFSPNKTVERNLLLAKLVRGILDELATWHRQGWQALRGAWFDCSIHTPGSALQVSINPAEKRRMYFTDLGSHGELIARDDSGKLHTIATGEVSFDVTGG